ncbi:MAG TPA: methyltransferase domain-containing protein [Thermoanaerobaculaceae bacterium]|nr:methyltransferase domain-containing protein [Thermoanaerobaculaceae bacterium]
MTHVSDELLDTLCCPVERRPLRPMTPDELRSLTIAIAAGRAGDPGGGRVAEPPEAGLATEDGTAFYPVLGGVPILLPQRRITIHDRPLPQNGRKGPPRFDSVEATWEHLASVWDTRRPPARPSPQDTALLERMVAEALAGRTAPRALMLGVTPEIATMHWPAGTRLLAIDASAAMIRKVWPAAAAPGAVVIRAEWAAMPIRDGAFDIVVGDASLGFQPYPDVFLGVVGETRRVLRDGGFLATRVYTRPETSEPIDAIFADLHAGRIGSMEFLWWRLYTAFHGDRTHPAKSSQLWDAWAAHVPDPAGLIETLGWPPGALRSMDALRGSPRTMTFPTLREYRDDLAGKFEEIACEAPEFENGDRNPTMVFRARPS